jgi:hypothetical protein
MVRLCSEGNTWAADFTVSPCNVAAMNRSSAVDMLRLWTEDNEQKSRSHGVGSIPYRSMVDQGGRPSIVIERDSTLELQGIDKIWLHICAMEVNMSDESNPP